MAGSRPAPDQGRLIRTYLRPLAARGAMRSFRKLLFSNAAFLMASTFVGSFFGFLFWVVAARTMAPAQVGLGAAYISALTFLTTLGEMGLGTALIRFAPGLDSRRGPFINSALLAVAVSTVTVSLVFALGTGLWTPELDELARSVPLLGLFLGSTLVMGLAQLVDRLFTAFEVSYFLLLRNLIFSILRVGLVVALAGTLGAFGLLSAVGLAALLSLAVSARVFLPRALPGYRVRPAFAWAELRDKLHYTLGNHLAILLWSAPALLYPLILVSLLGAEANAHFYISWMIANLLFVVPTALSTAALARAANAGHVSAAAFWLSMRRALLLVLPPSGLLLLASPWVLGMFGSSYSAAGQGLFVLLVLSVFPYAANTYVITYHRIQQNVRGVLAVSGITTVLCLALSMGGGLLLGLWGVGLGWLVGQSVSLLPALLSYETAARVTANVLAAKVEIDEGPHRPSSPSTWPSA